MADDHRGRSDAGNCGLVSQERGIAEDCKGTKTEQNQHAVAIPSAASTPAGKLTPGRLRYPSTIEANEATAAQIAAQSPSDKNKVSIKADRPVRRRSATPADPTDSDASTRRLRPSLG